MKSVTQKPSIAYSFFEGSCNDKFTQTSYVSLISSNESLVNKILPPIHNKKDENRVYLQIDEPIIPENNSLPCNEDNSQINEERTDLEEVDKGERDKLAKRECNGVAKDYIKSCQEPTTVGLISAEDVLDDTEPDYQPDIQQTANEFDTNDQDLKTAEDLLIHKLSYSKMAPTAEENNSEAEQKPQGSFFHTLLNLKREKSEAIPEKKSKISFVNVTPKGKKSMSAKSSKTSKTSAEEFSKSSSFENESNKDKKSITSKIMSYMNWKKPKETKETPDDNVSKSSDTSLNNVKKSKEKLSLTSKVSNILHINTRSKSKTAIHGESKTNLTDKESNAKTDQSNEQSDKNSHVSSYFSRESEMTTTYSPDYSVDSIGLNSQQSETSIKSFLDNKTESLKKDVGDMFQNLYEKTKDKVSSTVQKVKSVSDDVGSTSNTVKENENAFSNLSSKLPKLANLFKFKDYNDESSHFDKPRPRDISNVMTQDGNSHGIFSTLKDKVMNFFEGKHQQVVPHCLIINSDDNVNVKFENQHIEETSHEQDPISISKTASMPIKEVETSSNANSDASENISSDSDKTTNPPAPKKDKDGNEIIDKLIE